VRTRLSICARKARFVERNAAIEVAARSEAELRVYRCDRCLHFHLTSRTKGKRIARPV
jgi:hypothetical protein